LFTAETHDCRDAGGRVTQGAVTERAQRNQFTAETQRSLRKPKKIHRKDARDAKEIFQANPMISRRMPVIMNKGFQFR
jgi:hypothetical protein